MKHTMKKLLCMALAIMLLVSAVPVFAAAEGEIALSIYYVCDSTSVANGAERDVAQAKTILYNPETTTAKVAAEAALPVNNADIIEKLGINTNYAQIKDVRVDVVSENQVNYTVTLSAVDKPTETIGYVDAPIYDADVNTGKTIGVKCSLKVHSAPVYTEIVSIVAAPSAAEVKSALGTPYANKSINSINTKIIAYNNVNDAVAVFVTTGSITSTTPGDSGTTSGGSGGGTSVETPVNGGTTTTTYNVKFYDVNGSCHWNIDVASGSTVGIADNSTKTQISYAEANVGTKSGCTFSGWQKNGTGDVLSTATVADLAITANTDFRPVFTANSSSSGSGSSGTTTTNKFPYPVYLNIYKDTMVGSPDKRVEITKGIALDGLVTLSEVKTVVKNYYTAKDSDGITYDGLYLAKGNWVADYVADTAKYDEINAKDMTQYETVYINVMIGNAKSKSSSTADTSNPKTGDTIFVPVMVMGVTATALAAAYVFGKKRIAR